MSTEHRDRLIAFITLLICIVSLFFTAPVNGDFGWNESARNALSGAFVRDFILELPFDAPVRWAEDYYAKYPALVILFYPPLLHGMLGITYALLDVSHLSAVLVIFAFYTALIFGTYALARRFFDPMAAAGMALAYGMSPEVATWGRQIMHEVPAMALVVWSVVFGLRFLDDRRPGFLYAMAAAGVCALYTKQTTIVIIAPLGLFMLYVYGREILRNKHLWLTLGLSIVALIPLIVIQLKFASFNAVNATAHPSGVSGATFEGLTWYLARLPSSLGWIVVAPALIFVVWKFRSILSGKVPRDAVLLIFCFVVSYAFFTLISLKETRHGIPLYLPIVFAAVAFFWSLPLGKWRGWLSLAFGIVIFAVTLTFQPPHRDTGYAEAADFIAKHSPKDAIVLFAGRKDGDFIFNIRAHNERGDITILRHDKLFLNIKILPSLGLNAKDISEAQIKSLLTRYGVSYVVSDETSFIEAKVIQNLMKVLHSDSFEPVHKNSVTGEPNSFGSVDRLVVYRNLAELPEIPEKPDLRLEAAGKTISN